jgi:uncharacterized protein
MNSCLYECLVYHHRLEPKVYRFAHKLFMFYLDLDELDILQKKYFFAAYNGPGLYSFRDRDHLLMGGKTPKEKVLAYIRSKGVTDEISKISILTNLRTWGYVFNPVSFYYCFGPDGRPVCAVAEVGNTFGEMKPYILMPGEFVSGAFRSQQTKYFYISPFIDHDATLDFDVRIPGNALNVRVDDIKSGRKFFLSGISGHRRELSPARLLWYALRFPFITLQVIGLIHWHAFVLHFFKRVTHRRKEDHMELQREAVHVL